MSLTGCSYNEINNEIIDSSVVSMNFGAEVSSAIDAKIESSSCHSKTVKIVYDNGVTFTNTFSGNMVQTCSFEGSKEIIDAKIVDYTKVCFSNLNSQQLQKIIDSLINTGCYKETIDGRLYSVKYQDGYISFELSY